MNLENIRFTMCAKHPSQAFTGFCSLCLAERLSNFGSMKRSPARTCSPFLEEPDVSVTISDLGRKPQEVKARKTLLSLFHLDDGEKLDAGGEEEVVRSPDMMGQANAGKVGLCEIKCKPEIKAFQCGDEPESALTGVSFDRGSWVSEGRLETDVKASSSCSTTVESSSVDTGVAKKLDSAEDENLKQKGKPFWLGSVISRKVLKLRMVSALKKNSFHERSLCCGFEEKQSEAKPGYRHSCDWSLRDDSNKASWDDPRHSWDGSVMSKAFICSFACLEEAGDGNSRNHSESNGGTSLMSLRRKGSPTEYGDIDPKPTSVSTDVSVIEEEHLPPKCKVSKPLKDRFLEEPQHDTVVPSISRKVSHRWSKVWSWSINSPFRDFSQRREHVLERSFSESWREGHQVKIVGAESDSGMNIHGNGTNLSRANYAFSRNRYFGNGDVQTLKLDCQRNKQGYKFGRSRSVHYSSPGHLESGLLRFYLTPLRSSRRNSNRGRARTSRSYARGIFGLY